MSSRLDAGVSVHELRSQAPTRARVIVLDLADLHLLSEQTIELGGKPTADLLLEVRGRGATWVHYLIAEPVVAARPAMPAWTVVALGTGAGPLDRVIARWRSCQKRRCCCQRRQCLPLSVV